MGGSKPASASKKNAPPPAGQRSVLSFFQKVTPAKNAEGPERPAEVAEPVSAPAPVKHVAKTAATAADAPGSQPGTFGELEPSPAPHSTPTAKEGPAPAKEPSSAAAASKKAPAPSAKKKAAPAAAKITSPAKKPAAVAPKPTTADPASLLDAMEDEDGDGALVLNRPSRAAAKRARSKAKVVHSESEEEEEEEEGSGEDDEMEVSEYSGASEEESDSGSEPDADSESEDDDDDAPKKRGVKKPAARAPPAKKARKDPAGEETFATPAGGTKTAAAAPRAFVTPAPVQRTPPSGAKASLHKSLGVGGSVARRGGSPAADPPAIVMGVRGAELLGDAARFAERDAEKFKFLRPDRIVDGKGRRPDHPQYDPRTFTIPASWFKDFKVSDGQQQWWDFKSRHFDSVLLFKMGKFYELFEMDAHIGVEVLGLQYMKGDQPHAGFPEANYHSHAERLARAGYKVAVIEQTETPDQLKVRNEELKRRNQKQAKVVNRELVAVLTQGTLYDPEMLQSSPDASWLLALYETPLTEGAAPAGSVTMAACAVDVTTGEFLLGMWRDDELRPQLRAQLAALQPVEVIHGRPGSAGELSPTTLRILKGVLGGRRFNAVECPRGDAVVPLLEMRGYFATGTGTGADADADSMGVREPFPELLRELQAKELPGCLCAYGLSVEYLREALLDKAVVPLGRLGLLTIATEDAEKLAQLAAKSAAGAAPSLAEDPFAHVPYCRVDGSALESLEVLENSEGGAHGTLAAAVDRTATPGGRRTLRAWLSRPLVRPEDIRARQEAVHDLSEGAEEAAQEARKELHGLPDLERSLARLHASVAGGGTGRDAANVVLYEDAAKRRVQNLLDALKGLRAVWRAARCFAAPMEEGRVTSPMLRALVSPEAGIFPDLDAKLQATEAAADWKAAASTGRVQAGKGIDPEYDTAVSAEKSAQSAMDALLAEARRTLGGGKGVEWCVKGSMTYLEVPEALEKRVPEDWELMDTRKGFKRYANDAMREAIDRLRCAQAAKEKAQGSILANIVSQFVQYRATWQRAIDCMNQLDALTALAQAAALWEGPTCMPTFVPESAQGGVFRAKELRHPAGLTGSGALGAAAARSFVPNDVALGGSHPPFLVLTGPNMGGKSTLLRQVCLATLLAQVGGRVPAAQLELTPADALYVRMGAKDRIMAGQSTFFVELSEAAAMLQHATSRSLVALDELGRGTATTDGCAIAAAVLHHLSTQTKCRGLFATHYHHLLSDQEVMGATHTSLDLPHVSTWHMACAVKPGDEPGKPEDVTFLYKLRPGSCPRSYGVNVAKLAGLPDAVVRRAYQKASELEGGGARRDAGAHAEAEAAVCLALRQVAQLAASSRGGDRDEGAVLAKLVRLQAAWAEVGGESDADGSPMDTSN